MVRAGIIDEAFMQNVQNMKQFSTLFQNIRKPKSFDRPHSKPLSGDNWDLTIDLRYHQGMVDDLPRLAAASRGEYSLTISDVAARYETAGFPRTIRTLQQIGDLPRRAKSVCEAPVIGDTVNDKFRLIDRCQL
jgi:hypothetical protein